MKIRDICSREVVTAHPNQTLAEAAALMRKRHVGALVAVEQPEARIKPVGIVTDRDIVIAIVAVSGARPEGIRVCDIMSTRLVLAGADDGVFEAARAMSERGVRRLPVVAADGTLFGIVTANDLYRVMANEMASLAAAVKGGVEREALEQRLEILRHRFPARPVQ
jgi:CBS domain-containing protein